MELSLKNIKKISELKGKKVFVCGVFDLFHPGHAFFLNESKKKGDYLIIGLFSDSMSKKYKGKERPIIPFKERLSIIEAMESSDFIIPLKSPPDLSLIDLIKPEIIVMGEGDEYFGKEIIDKHKDIIKKVERIEPYSTSYLIERILKRK